MIKTPKILQCLLCLKSLPPPQAICSACQRDLIANRAKTKSNQENYLLLYKSSTLPLLQEFREKQNPVCQKILLHFFKRSRTFQQAIKKSDAITVIPNRKKWWQPNSPSAMEVLAKKLSEQYELPFLWQLLYKKNHQQHKTKTAQERYDAPLFIFLNQDKQQEIEFIQEKKILLLDDVFTTGTSLAQAEYLLKTAGAVEMFFFTLSYADLEYDPQYQKNELPWELPNLPP